MFFIWGLVMAGCGVLGVLLVFQGGLVMANKWIKILIHYVTTFAVGGIATWAFKWNASQWLISGTFWNTYD